MRWRDTEGALSGGLVAGVDFETTGLVPGEDRIVQVGIVCFDGPRITDAWSSFCCPEGKSFHPKASKVNGLVDADVADAPLFGEEAADRLDSMTEGRLVIAHRLPFDASFWAAESERIGVAPPVRSGMCSKALAAAAGWSDNDLFGLAADAGLTAEGRPHEALADATACVQLAKRASFRLGGYRNALRRVLRLAADDVRWFEQVASGPGQADAYRAAFGVGSRRRQISN